MADVFYDLLKTQGDAASLPESLDALASEPQKLAQSSHTILLALQALSKKWHKSIIDSADRHVAVGTGLRALADSTEELRNAMPKLDNEAVQFSTTYTKSGESNVLARRKRALLLSRNVERLVDVLELPTMLSSAISVVPANHASALELNGHIRRLHGLYPTSPLVASIAAQADEAMRAMAANLILSLKGPNLKLAASIRTVGWLRRVLPDLEMPGGLSNLSQDRVLGALFLVCRLATLMSTLEALEPLRELADQEKTRQKSIGSGNSWSGGQQTERYLKRYIEIFREQSFAIVSMFRSIFPAAPGPGEDEQAGKEGRAALECLPSALATYPLHLVDMLLHTLRHYLPNVKDQASRDSLLTQVMYCAGSLGRLGGDFGLFLADLHLGEGAEQEWVDVVKRHRQLAGRLESIVGDQKERGSRQAL